MAIPEVRPESRVRLRDILKRREGDRFIIGNEGLGEFFAVDLAAVRAIELLRSGKTVVETENALKAELGQEIDVADAARFLASRGLVAEIDGRAVPVPDDVAERLASAPPSRPSRVALLPLATLALASLAIVVGALVARPEWLPSPANVALATRSPLLTILAATLASLVVVSLHETGHWAVARAFGVRSRIRLATRAYFVVLETDVTNAWKLPRGPRVAIFLAGIGVNLLLSALAVLALGALERGLFVAPWLPSIAAAVLFLNFYQIAFQFLVFLRTDLYFVFVTATGEWNLHGDASSYFSDRARSALAALRKATTGRARVPERATPPLTHTRHAFSTYATLLVAGLLLVAALAAFTLPDLVRTLGGVALDRARLAVEGGSWTLALEALALAAYVAFLLFLVFNFYVVRGARWLARAWRDSKP